MIRSYRLASSKNHKAIFCQQCRVRSIDHGTVGTIFLRAVHYYDDIGITVHALPKMSPATELDRMIDRKLNLGVLKENPGGFGGVWINRSGVRRDVG